MDNYTYLLLSCNEKKEHQGASVLFSFSPDDEPKVLTFIQEHSKLFFNGSERQQRERSKEFFERTIFQHSLIDAINTYLGIYAMVQQVPKV